MKKVVLVTGGFDPLHSGHIAYFKAAKELGDTLVVGINSDAWLERKKGKAFMPMSERFSVISALSVVDTVLVYNDDDGSSCDAIRLAKIRYPNAEIIFANGGDRTKENIPEMSVPDVTFKFGVGGDTKLNSSSWILEEWRAPKTVRPWGYYRVLHNPNKNVKVKELTVDPGKRLSMQRHQHRAEFWFVAEGTATVKWDEHGHTTTKIYQTEKIQRNEWHQLINETDQPLKIVEIQYGDNCDESDIERR
jgi:cytidyltransferase-like protein